MTPSLPGLPSLAWTGEPGQASFDPGSETLTLTAGRGVDWTNDALGGPQQHAASALAFLAPETDFTLSARVRVAGERTTFDAAALVIWSDEDHWAKLCFELSPHRQPMIVSVVTDRYSDDCNSAEVSEAAVHLRIARVGPAFAFHSSSDGVRWEFRRLFRLSEGARPFRAGFLSQAPMGDTCTAEFDGIRLRDHRLDDLRDGG